MPKPQLAEDRPVSNNGAEIHETPEMADYRARRLAFYEACLSGWLQTTFEKDKSILAISSGSLAIVFGVIFQAAGTLPIVSILAYLVSGFLFAASICLCVVIFSKNAAIFEAAISDDHELSLRFYDRLLNAFFLFGMIALLAGGTAEAVHLISQRTRTVATRTIPGKMVGDSASGLKRLEPKPPPNTQRAPAPQPLHQKKS